MKLFLNSDQRDELQELGISQDLGSFYETPCPARASGTLITQVYSIDDILRFIPKDIQGCGLEMYYRKELEHWEVGYPGLPGGKECFGEELIDCFFDLLVWLIKGTWIDPRNLKKEGDGFGETT